MTEARAITFAFSRLPAIPCSIPTVRQPNRHCHRMFMRARLHYDNSEEHYQKNARKYWDNFYRRHKNKFFKDRHYLVKDWGSYFAGDSLFPNNKVVLEVGCGAGNSIFPLLASYPNLYVHACDFSAHAIAIVKSHPVFKEDCLNAFVCDVIHDDLSQKIEASSIDIVTLIFTMSAVSPKEMPLILQNIKRVLKPTGYVLFRDYGIGDFAQVKLQERKQMINENFYVRGDGTCSFYFSESFLSTLFSNAGFQAVDIDVYCKRIENRSMFITMDRRWIRAIFNSSTCIAPDSAFSQELDDCLDPQIG